MCPQPWASCLRRTGLRGCWRAVLGWGDDGGHARDSQVESEEAEEELSTGEEEEELLGEGATGQVHMKRDPDGTWVAIKRMKANSHLALREIDLLRRAQTHPHVVRFRRASIHADGQVHVVMHCEGRETLMDLLHRRRPPARARLRMQHGVAAGVAHLHSRGIAHMDLKPDNIAVGEAMHVRLLDFGLSLAPREGQTAHGVRGTREYGCPEMLLGREYDPFLADAWSLGVVVYAIEFNRLPFEEASSRCRSYWTFKHLHLVEGKTVCESIREVYRGTVWVQRGFDRLMPAQTLVLSRLLSVEDRAEPQAVLGLLSSALEREDPTESIEWS
mgnify:CR=1 FL=1